ncbi:endonuclease/exonuclease/phosphatase family protein [Roseivirga pacifica]|uniref:endonuclease/exonuclease/phosphatase family protein n=1 Tax=Roseivirga pacifica TaxID=1267423 RepID=UPI002094168D|nr:endonuclease/exonuclease/phosphatase family protein [Roseivirga pacifica]MCO6357150.1 hypothetical protein [Roseivirga pacifica]MCO6368137.1 hypothetical protein [Roseivirga pacifica]MCO6369382.1 hypothetical protein [Roseivirga pacifica]MCO6373236.1 hypothetical protein [Roseivirga pacifica]MCO6377507.1 hypothetical protein [Roseivirga pacifica]
MKKAIPNLLFFIAVSVTLICLASYFAKWHWSLDLLSHFRFQYLVILSISTVLLIFLKRKKAILFTPLVLLLLIEILPFYFGGKKVVHTENSVKLSSINLLSSNSAFSEVTAFVASTNPDILVLQEYNGKWHTVLSSISSNYPYQLAIPQENNFGIAIFSKLSFSELKMVTMGSAQLPSIVGEFNLNGTKTTLIATHPLPPIGAEYANLRNNQLAAIAAFVQSNNHETILVGDLNTSSFSPHFKSLLKTTGLVDSRKGHGLQPTWPANITPLRVTLDHCLVSSRLLVKSRKIGERIGSDHLPIVVELGVD